MMIAPICDRCGKELSDFGGILFSPPEGGKVLKHHICKTCYGEVSKTLSHNKGSI